MKCLRSISASHLQKSQYDPVSPGVAEVQM